jgi:formamidopyrimidine-DNA glycosylase
MPELPEVETTRRGIQPFIEHQHIKRLVVRHRGFRWPIPEGLETLVIGQTIHHVERRAKYLLLKCDSGTLIIHLGMSGRIRILDSDDNVGKHDHVDLYTDNGYVMRFTDPRRFGAVLWTDEETDAHPLIAHLGPEPLSTDFDGAYLTQRAKGRKTAIKPFLMNGEIVVGVGNIYANEALFSVGIHPETPAGQLTKKQMGQLVDAVKAVLSKAIEAGGTTLRDFRKSDGKPGYFTQSLNVYGRANEACLVCGTPIVCIRQAQRASYFCPQCQKNST